jgi:protoheme IX farnesyltransferase
MTLTASSAWRDYYVLTKPGIIRGNLLACIGGFFLGSSGAFLWSNFFAVLAGTSLVIGSACVINNYLDRNIDKHMSRTKDRALASGRVTAQAALLFGATLGMLGFAILLIWTNSLTALLGLVGFVTYVAVYTPAKHRTPYATLLGTIPGAVPPVAGYTAASGHLTLACALLFVILVAWQMPHFFAIAIRRLNEYKAAKVPVWPAVYGRQQTRMQMIMFAGIFLLAIIAFGKTGYASDLFVLVMLVYGVYWASKLLKPITNEAEWTPWAKTVFLVSLPFLPLFMLLTIVDFLLYK